MNEIFSHRKVRNSFDIEKAIATIKFILRNMPEQSCDFHKLFKIIYFAERQHLSKYGRVIIGDRFIAMKDGPVPSTIYDILKILRGDDNFFDLSIDLSHDLKVQNGYFVESLNNHLEIDIFSESEIECLTSSIQENKNLSFQSLSQKSHDSAWQAANRDDRMSDFDIAEAGGASPDLLNYMSVLLENKHLNLI